MTNELTLIVGSTEDFDLFLFDDQDNAENLAAADAATFVVKVSVSDSTNILLRRTADSNLTINIADSKLVGTITQPEADALVAGRYIGDVAVRFGSVWKQSKRFAVNVLKAMSPHTV